MGRARACPCTIVHGTHLVIKRIVDGRLGVCMCADAFARNPVTPMVKSALCRLIELNMARRSVKRRARARASGEFVGQLKIHARPERPR